MVLETVGLPPDDITIMLAVEWLLDIYNGTDAGPPGRGKDGVEAEGEEAKTIQAKKSLSWKKVML